MANIKAFVLDAEAMGVDPEASDPYTFGVFPGLWLPGRPVAPEALGLEYRELKDLIDRLDLPLVEVSVAEGKALKEFPSPGNTMEAGPLTFLGEFAEDAELRPESELVQLAAGPVALPPDAPKLNLQPATAAAIAETSARYLGDEVDAEAVEAAEDDPEQLAGATAEEAAKGGRD